MLKLGTLKRTLTVLLRIVLALSCLYFFICSLDVLSTAFKLVSGKTAGNVFNAPWLNNPLVGLMIGILGTVCVQSSSTFTSIIIAAVGAGMDVHIAIPMIMGANIGTSVTNTLVAITQIGNRDEFEKAFSAATVHDMFNWSTVIILFPIECLFRTDFLESMTAQLADALIGQNVTGVKVKILKHITEPLTKSLIQIDKGVLKKWASNQTCEDCRLLKTGKDFVFNITTLNDQEIGGILIFLSLIILCASLMIMVKSLNSLLKGTVATTVKKFLNPKFKSPILQYFFGYWNILLGVGCTIILQSSSIFTSTLTPMVGVGLVEVETVYPLFLGSNIGTTFTAMLAALTQGGSNHFKSTVQGALVHLFFNIIGILIFYPIPFMRIPIPLCKMLGRITAKYRWFAFVYILIMFFLLPSAFVALTFIDERGVAMYTFLAFLTLIIIVVLILNIMQSNERMMKLLPIKLRNWNFLPKYLRSLEPYDNFLTGWKCCKRFQDNDIELGIHGKANPGFDQES